MPRKSPSLDTFRGCLLGGALGDALGYPVEFIKAAQISARFGTQAPEKLTFDGATLARISDDTQMTLFTAEGLIRAKQRVDGKGICHPPTIMAFALLRWYETQGGDVSRSVSQRGWLVDDRRLHSQRAPGNTCMSALRSLASKNVGSDLPTVERPPNDSKGCGAVMRVAPCGLGVDSREVAFELARDNGVITHGHPSGYLSAGYFASVVWDLARGSSIEGAMSCADELLARERGHEEMSALVVRAKEVAGRGVPDVAAIESLGGGWTGEEALAIGLLCALTFNENEPRAVEQALWRAAAHSGDSDSTAAITGNLLGTMLGVAALPAAWLDCLELRDVIDRLASDLYASLIRNETLDDYPGN